MTREVLSENALEEDFMACAVKFSQLQRSSGQTYEGLIEDFENKQQQVAELEDRKKNLENKVAGLKAKLKDAEANLANVKSEIDKATTAKNGMEQI